MKIISQAGEERREERDLISPQTTPLMSGGLKMTLMRIKERQKHIEDSRPEDKTCPGCQKAFSPIWDSFEERWKYPDLTEDGICNTCKRLNHIRENIEEYLSRAGVPPKYLKCTFDNFKVNKDNRHPLKICKEYAEDPDSSLFLYGPYGTGKTHLAVAITRELLQKGREVIFISVPRLLFEIRKAFKEDTHAESDYVERYTSIEYLILDDFGVEKTTEWARQTLNYIIYERDNYLKPTVITSNLSLDEISEKLDGRISSRISGMGKVIQLKGEDFRLKRHTWR